MIGSRAPEPCATGSADDASFGSVDGVVEGPYFVSGEVDVSRSAFSLSRAIFLDLGIGTINGFSHVIHASAI
jgi:hypothetical protein